MINLDQRYESYLHTEKRLNIDGEGEKLMGLMGISNGLTNVLISSFWAEIYGVNYLGSIKALTASLMVFSTALATSVFGVLIDLGYSIENIAFLCAIYTAISVFIVIIFKNSYKPILVKNKS